MPYLRFNRDKRGYENTYVVHSERRRGKSQTRILYWFRTPPGVRVGRAALDEDAIRLIEELNPFMEFDWTRILKGQGVPPTEARPPEEARRGRNEKERDRDRDRGRDREGRQQQRRDSGQRPQGSERPPRGDRPPPPVPVEETPAEELSTVAPIEDPVAEFHNALQSPDVTGDAVAEPRREDTAEPVDTVATPAHARVGAEGVQRLRARHAEILARISEKALDPTRREELKSLADRLNPDMWVTDTEVTQGLEQYESVFASLREVVGRKRRRRRRGGRSGAGGGRQAPANEAPTAEADAAARDGGGEYEDHPDDPDGGEEPGSGHV